MGGFEASDPAGEVVFLSMFRTLFERFSDDRFFISVETADPEFDPTATRALLERAGALAIEEVAA